MAASGTSDALTLRMLGQILAPSKCTLVNLEGAGSPMQLAERVAEDVPGDGHPVAPASGGPCAGPLPGPAAPGAVRRAADPGRRWGEAGSDAASEGLSGVGATHVAFTLADARDQILARAASAVPATAMTADAGDLDLTEHPCRADLRADSAVKAGEPLGL